LARKEDKRQKTADNVRRNPPKSAESPPTQPNHTKPIHNSSNQHFDVFWSNYPRKTAKHKAKESWDKISDLNLLFEKIVAAVAEQSKTKQWQDGIIPHASTWLNQKRWEDEIDTKLGVQAWDQVKLKKSEKS